MVVDERALDAHRRELHIHCYRLLANFDEAEDAVQEALTRAWQARERFGGERNVRAWLYRIATNVCLDRMRQLKTLDRSFAEVSWLTPYPDTLLDEPEAIVVARETIELAFLAVIQLLPPRQRAVLILRDVLEWSAAETAAALEMTVPAVTSALQRARATIAANRPPERAPSEHERELLAGFIDAHQRMDADASLALVREDIRITMPPHPMYFCGRGQMRGLFDQAREMGEWRLIATGANRMPTAASYLRAPGDSVFRAFKFDVLRVEDRQIAETTTFMPDLFERFGLPLTLDV
ncbi:MAG: RNA polymerase subunit sigma-70 [Solirubrobacterales bacterium]|nr:RNA polymerase subunit sigma-70 [Solirubrobacterales bacterium]